MDYGNNRLLYRKQAEYYFLQVKKEHTFGSFMHNKIFPEITV